MSDVGAYTAGEQVAPRAARDAGASVPDAGPAQPEELSLGELVGRMTSDLTVLFRQEIELAKVELKEEAAKAGKGAGILGGGAFAGYLAAVMLSFAAAWALAVVMSTGFAFLVVGILYAAAAGVMLLAGRKEMKSVHGPHQTVQTVKEDARWVRKPTS